jgi:poly(A) polymerase
VPHVVPENQREFAVEVVRQLRDHGFEAYWAGGCVRDQLLSRTPYDYDVATSAHPEEIRRVFKHRKTLAVGAAFGVMTVLGPRGAGQIEVATFRQDVGYSDGRHPDRIAFSSPQQDAQRRDFTINGMFYDPLEQRVIDYVGGETDLRNGIVRAIGDARQRIAEDKLRMLRAVRFASIFDFHLEASTRAAICDMASEVTVVSAERIADEMRIILVHPARVRAIEMLKATGLLPAILPGAAGQLGERETALLAALDAPTFPLAMSVLLHAVPNADVAETVGQRWRLARAETERIAWLIANQRSLSGASTQPWSQLQPLLVRPGADELIAFHAARAAVGTADPHDVEFCRTQLQRPTLELDPPVLLTGDDLIGLGIPRGPVYARLLKAVRAAQLDGLLANRTEALALAQRLNNAIE